jgi:hypothetical protein
MILAHQYPGQLKRLVDKLNHADCNFYIHIDKNANVLPFVNALNGVTNVYFLKDDQREYGTWGDIGIVKATINILDQIVKDDRSGFCILLSGQCYPIKSNGYIKSFLTDYPTTNFISINTMPDPLLADEEGGMRRILHYKINRTFKRHDAVMLPSIFESAFYKIRVIKNIISLLRIGKYRSLLKIFKKRKFPTYLNPYRGDQWWALPIETVKKILDFQKDHKDYYNYHKDSLLPDEMFFQSIVMYFFYQNNRMILKPTLTYTNWERENVTLPVTFTESDFEELKAQPADKLFARKFDMQTDEQILNRIDKIT